MALGALDDAAGAWLATGCRAAGKGQAQQGEHAQRRAAQVSVTSCHGGSLLNEGRMSESGGWARYRPGIVPGASLTLKWCAMVTVALCGEAQNPKGYSRGASSQPPANRCNNPVRDVNKGRLPAWAYANVRPGLRTNLHSQSQKRENSTLMA